MSDTRELIIIGGGPAGYTAALYAARANLQPLVIEGFNWGGQLMVTSDVENYPGYADGVMGPEMMAEFRRQAERFGAEFITDDVTRVDFSEQPHRVWVENDEYSARTVIIATGANARWLGLPREQHYQGRGLSACAPTHPGSPTSRPHTPGALSPPSQLSRPPPSPPPPPTPPTPPPPPPRPPPPRPPAPASPQQATHRTTTTTQRRTLNPPRHEK